MHRAIAQRHACCPGCTTASVCLRQFSSSRFGQSSRACAPRLSLRASRRDDGGERVRHQVGELERLHQVGVPDHRAVGDLDVGHLGRRPPPSCRSPRQRLVGAEDRRVLLHRPLHLEPQLGGRHRRRRHGAAGRSARPPPRPTPGSAAGSASPRSTTSPARIAAARPKTTRSIRLFDPSRFAPCTLAQPASPTAISPGWMRSGLCSVGFSASPQ